MKTLKTMHYTDNYIINPANPITVNLIGAGGTGSRMLTELARMNHSLTALGHTGLQVYLYDDDIITTANQGRQLFADTEVGLHKAVALINRANRFFGSNWKAVTEQYNASNLKSFPNKGKADICISCVDTIKARFDIGEILENQTQYSHWERNRCLYWLDMGNSLHTGQVILSTVAPIKQPESKLYHTVTTLPMVTTEYRELLQTQSDTSEPSCSLAQALEKQDLFINASLASLGASLLWKLFREGMTQYRGFFLNLSDFRMMPLCVG